MRRFGTATEENQLDPLRDQQVDHAARARARSGSPATSTTTAATSTRSSPPPTSGNNPQRHLILQELIHGDHFDDKGREGSWEMLYRAAELKCDFPSQVHFLFANHDLAQIHGEGIMKAGLSVCEAFNAGVKRDFGDRASTCNVAITEFLLSLPLAARTHDGLFFCHSMPTDEQMDDVRLHDLRPPAHRRRLPPPQGPGLPAHLGPPHHARRRGEVPRRTSTRSSIVTGHQPQETGYLVNGDQHLIIASDHNQGVFLPVDLSKPNTRWTSWWSLTKFVAVDLPDEM